MRMPKATTRPAGFHDHQIDIVIGQQGGQIASLGSYRLKAMRLRLGIEKAAHRAGFAKVNCENVHASLRGRGLYFGDTRVLPHVITNRVSQHSQLHGLAWILFVSERHG